MSIRLMSAVFESTTLGPTERLLMLALADHADEDGRCYPSLSRLCQRTGLGERAVQNNIRKLVEQGYVRVVSGGGRSRPNLYFISANPASSATYNALNPASETPFIDTNPALETPFSDQNPASRSVNPASRSVNPAPDAGEPSITTIEPSESDQRHAKPVDILSEVASPTAARSFIDFRKKIKKPLTETAATRLSKSLTEIRDQGGDPDDALGMAEERGWQAIKPEWYFKEQGNAQLARNSSGRQQPFGGEQLSGLAGAAMRRRAAREQGHGG